LTASMFHLWTHAFFKALMFLAAGSVLHALHHKADVWEMGGLLKKMPITGGTFVVGGLAIAGIPPFAGFWSKDEILLMAYNSGHYVLFAMAALTAFMTAFYMWRLIFLAFFGDEKPENHPHESPWTMTMPLVVLAVMATIGGLVGTPWTPWDMNWANWIWFHEAHHGEPNYMIMIGSVVLAASGIFLAYQLYCVDKTKARAHALADKYRALHTLSFNKFYIDEIYLWFNHSIIDGAAKLFFMFDIYIMDGIIINGIAAVTRLFGEGARVSQTGRLQNYALVFFLGVLAVAVILAFTDPSSAGLMLGGVK
ncbi:MAG: NADH dehydrogenase, partial [Peptococcaceae bacterium BRH_c4b]